MRRSTLIKPTYSWTNSPNHCSSTKTHHRWPSNAPPSSARSGIHTMLYLHCNECRKSGDVRPWNRNRWFDLLCILEMHYMEGGDLFMLRVLCFVLCKNKKKIRYHHCGSGFYKCVQKTSIVLSHIFLYSIVRSQPVFRSLKTFYTAPPAGWTRPSHGSVLPAPSQQPEASRIMQTPFRSVEPSNKQTNTKQPLILFFFLFILIFRFVFYPKYVCFVLCICFTRTHIFCDVFSLILSSLWHFCTPCVHAIFCFIYLF